MKRVVTSCDICGCEIGYLDNSSLKIKYKAKIRDSFQQWERADICGLCLEKIAERSRKERRDGKI